MHCYSAMVTCFFFFFNDTATTEIYTYCHTLSLHDALPICASRALVSRPSSAARTAGQVGGAMLIPGPKPVAALGKAGPAVSRAIQGAVGGAAVRDSDTSGLPEAGIGAVANVVLPPIIGKIASTKPVQAVAIGRGRCWE